MKGKIMKYIYTDGACSGNPGPGGWGYVVLDENDKIIHFFRGERVQTTNNEMELIAILAAYRYIQENPNESYIVYTDSAYCCNLINTWMHNWKNNGWMRPKNQPVKNLDIIKRIYKIFR
jgi:ribonuclease HI